MKELSQIILLIFILYSCNSKSDDQQKVVTPPYSEKINEIDSLIENKNENNAICNCDSNFIYNYNRKTDLSFSTTKGLNSNDFKKWSNDSIASLVKSIFLKNFDTIPEKLSIFKNVERLVIESRNGINGIDIFPKLEILEFWGSKIDINSNQKWISKIKVFRGEKSRFSGLSSLESFSELKELILLHSGFKDLSLNINELKCLTNLKLRAYTGLVIDLNEIDLNELECLKNIYIQDAYNTLKGIPSNIEESQLSTIYVNNISMNKEEKRIISEFKKKKSR